MEETEIKNEIEPSKRPVSLIVLCVLTFIYSGMGCLSALITPLFSDIIIEFIKNTTLYDETVKSEVLKVLEAGLGYYLITFLLAACSLTGAICMINLKKIGFHLYTASNLALLLVPTLLLGVAISWAPIMVTTSFILMYSTKLKCMK